MSMLSNLCSDLRKAADEGYCPNRDRILMREAVDTIESLSAKIRSNTKSRQESYEKGLMVGRRQAEYKIKALVNEFEEILSNIREKNVDDSVCGLCEYDADHGIDGYANECPGFERDDCFKLNEKYREEWLNVDG